MSRVLPDPQIVSLRAMRAGDIAMALPSPGTMTVGVTKSGVPSPEGLKSVSVTTTQATNSPDATPSIDLTNGSFTFLGVVDSSTTSQDALISVPLSGAGSFPEIFFEIITSIDMPTRDLSTGGTFPALTVTHGTSVV